MRALIQLTVRRDTKKAGVIDALRDWLEAGGFLPEQVILSGEVQTALREEQNPQLDSFTDLRASIPNRHAAEILSSIPLADQERQFALLNVQFVIRFYDNAHGATVWGLVSVDGHNVELRWRHRISRSLERTTEEFVEKVWEDMKENPSKHLFEKFTSRHRIPVREPNSTTDAYVGEILPPRERVRERAKRDKRTELWIAKIALGTTIICLALGFYLFNISAPADKIRWLSGALDRLATTGAATAAVSFLNYLFHLRNLQRKPVIDWQ